MVSLVEVFLLSAVVVACINNACAGSAISSALDLAERTAQLQLEKILSEWEVNRYPKFLKSCWMEEQSWDIMKAKIVDRALSSLAGSKDMKFVISFTGSSVTAGHDSPFQLAFPALVNGTLYPVFQALGVALDVRNVAVGNNPCIPYDICVQTFAGSDADVVVWEQTYNCGGDQHKTTLEQFLRQSLYMPSHPVVVYTDSVTPNWKKDKCSNVSPHVVSPDEQVLLNASVKDLVTRINGPEYRKWGSISAAAHAYAYAGVQAFTHSHYAEYKCQGPYVPDWGVGAASWHPSKHGHRLRAAQYSHVWLSIVLDGIQTLKHALEPQPSEMLIRSAMSDVSANKKNLDSLQRWPSAGLPPSLHDSNFTNNMTCYTDYQPKAVSEASLLRALVGGDVWIQAIHVDETILRPLFSADQRRSKVTFNESGCSSGSGSDSGLVGLTCWRSAIFEFANRPTRYGALRHIIGNGYQDFKFILYGDNSSGLLSFGLTIQKSGYVFLCEAPGVRRTAGTEEDKLWRAYLSPFSLEFQFQPDFAVPLEYFHHRGLDVCWQFDRQFVAGSSLVLSVEATTSQVVYLAYLLVP